MKGSRSLSLFILVFIMGFVAGVLFSAWKLPKFFRAGDTDYSGGSEVSRRIAGLEKMVESNPNNVQALIQLANDYHDMGNHSKAVDYYSRAIAMDPTNPDVITDMGTSYRKLGRSEEAVKAYRRALEVDPNHALAMFNLGIVLRDDFKDYAGALKVWEMFMERAGSNPHSVMVNRWVVQLREKLGVSQSQPEGKSATEVK